MTRANEWDVPLPPACLGCNGPAHGGVVEHIRCLERALARERQHPDRLRGQAAREAYEAWEGMRKR